MRQLFIGGSGRCGTTRALEIIGAHPDVYAVPRELKLDPYSVRNLAEWRTKWAVATRMAAKENAKWIVEKSPGNTLIADWLLAEFPDSLYLTVKRDRSATLASLMRFAHFPIPGHGRPGYVQDATAYFAYIEDRAGNLKQRHPSRCYSVDIEEFDTEMGDYGFWPWLDLETPKEPPDPA